MGGVRRAGSDGAIGLVYERLASRVDQCSEFPMGIHIDHLFPMKAEVEGILILDRRVSEEQVPVLMSATRKSGDRFSPPAYGAGREVQRQLDAVAATKHPWDWLAEYERTWETLAKAGIVVRPRTARVERRQETGRHRREPDNTRRLVEL